MMGYVLTLGLQLRFMGYPWQLQWLWLRCTYQSIWVVAFCFIMAWIRLVNLFLRLALRILPLTMHVQWNWRLLNPSKQEELC